MKISIIQAFISVLTVLILVSCEKEVNNIKYPEFKSKWNISGYLSPDNLVSKIILGQNLRNYGNPWQIEDMGYPKVSLSDGTNLIVLDSTQMRYGIKSSDFPIEEGRTYTLEIKTDKGFNAEASCTVPFGGNFDLEIDTTITRYLYQDSILLLTVHPDFYFTDIKGVDNYYMIFCEKVVYSSTNNPSMSVNALHIGQNPYFNDKGMDGSRSKISIEATGVSNMSDSSFIKIYLLNTDKTYYDYKKSVEKYKSGENPFTEPSPVNSNITGGLGIFASYTVDSLILRLK